MPRDKSLIWKEYKDIPSEGFKGQRVECKHCGHQFIGQAPKLENHLNRCDSYTRHLTTKSQYQPTPGLIDSHTHRCGPVEQAKLDKLLGRAIFGSGLSFGTFDKWRNPNMYKFIHALNTAYSVPERHTITGRLLSECYIDVENQVKNLLTDCQWLNFTTDESDDNARRRIANLSVNFTTHSCLFLRNYHTGASNQSADFLLSLIAPGIEEAWNGDLARCNSLATDTCSAMRSLHTKMGRDTRFQHVFFVLCDFHGIQLFIKKILELPAYSPGFKKTQSIAASFSHSRLQLAILQEKQAAQYGRNYAIILSVITRWGSQYNLIKSLIRSKDALKAYAVDSRSSLTKDKRDLGALLLDRKFWAEVEELEEVLRPVHEAQLSSEDDTAHLGHVTKRWLGMKEALTTLHQGGASGLYDIFRPEGIWAEVYKKQTTDIHWVAYYLDPASAGAIGSSDHIQQAVFSFMRRYVRVTDPEWHQVISDFWDFQGKQGRFPLNEPNGI